MTLLNFYEEIGKDYKERKMPMEYVKSDQGIEVYKLWNELNKK